LGSFKQGFNPPSQFQEISPPKEIFNPTTPHGDSHEDEDSLAFKNSPIHLCKEDHNPQNSPYVGKFWEMFDLH
jgi:hypothetical protein